LKGVVVSRQDIAKALTDAKPQIAKFWASCRDSGLEGHSADLTGKVDRALENYVVSLSALKEGSAKASILAVLKALFARLDEINEEADGALLETDEREILVPVIIDAAVAAGLKVSEFKDGDPTMEFRNF
jgi:hypothetical protein